MIYGQAMCHLNNFSVYVRKIGCYGQDERSESGDLLLSFTTGGVIWLGLVVGVRTMPDELRVVFSPYPEVADPFVQLFT